MEEFPLDKFNIEVAVFKSTLTAVKGPPETDTPKPAPIVNVPVPTKPPAAVKFIAVVGVKVPVAVAVGTVKVPEVWVKPPLNTILELVVTFVVTKEPVLVIKPLKVVAAVLSLSVKTPAFVKAPVTTRVPVELTVNCEPAVVLSVPLIVFAAAAPDKVKIDVAVFKSTLAAVKGPPETVTPRPASIVNVPVAVNPPDPAKLMATVGVSVLFAPIVAAPPLNVPAVFVKPPLNNIFAAVTTAVEVQVPAVFVTKPVKVLTPAAVASVKFPAMAEVPVIVKFPEVGVKVAVVPIVRFPATVRLAVPNVKALAAPVPAVKFALTAITEFGAVFVPVPLIIKLG